ncbi:MAG TPA: glycine zipper domain-containing protein [Syntrophorhabdales bacterium]|nr:glycine zipper domain-containing protein [Syntrophorhabdales bacterium]
MEERRRNIFLAITVCLVLVLSSGCSTTNSGIGMNKPETGGLGGAGMGALLGQTGCGSATGTLMGAGVGAGLGYLIGNEADKKEAHTRQMVTEQDVRPLANTSWQVVSVTPKPAEPIRSVVGRFNADGTVTTTTAYWDGRTVTDTDSERYRIVGQTLIINQDDWVINATFRLNGDSLYVDTGSYALVMERLLTVASRDSER